MSEYIIDLSKVEKSSDRFKFLFNESILLGKRIVRCRDCKFKDELWNCAAPYYVEPNGFCAWGAQKEVEDAEAR